MGQWLTERLGQPFIIDNRPGAGSNVAAEVVVRAPADGYTLFFANVANAVNATLYEKLNFDFIRDITSAELPEMRNGAEAKRRRFYEVSGRRWRWTERYRVYRCRIRAADLRRCSAHLSRPLGVR